MVKKGHGPWKDAWAIPGDDAKKLGWFTINQMEKMYLSPYNIEIINKLFVK